MVKTLFFLTSILLVLGYGFVEVARYKRSRHRHSEDTPYPRARLTLRGLAAAILLALVYVLIFWESLGVARPVLGSLLPLALAVLIGLLIADMLWVMKHARQEQARRQAEFLGEVSQILSARRKLQARDQDLQK